MAAGCWTSASACRRQPTPRREPPAPTSIPVNGAISDSPLWGVTVADRYDIPGASSNTGGALTRARLRTGVRPPPAPLAFLPVPSTAGVPIQKAAPLTVNSLLPTVLQPGIYQGGIHIT